MAQTPRLEVGDKAPSFSLADADGNKVSLADYRGRKVIVYFYPAASTPGCTKEACDFRDNLRELNDAGLDVVGISPDKPEKLAKFRDAEKLTFPLLSDPDREGADRVGRLRREEDVRQDRAGCVAPSNTYVDVVQKGAELTETTRLAPGDKTADSTLPDPTATRSRSRTTRAARSSCTSTRPP